MTKPLDSSTRQGRQLTIVLIGTALLWVLAQSFGPALGLSLKYQILVDLFALAAFVWCMFVAYGLWRKRRD